MNQKYPIKAFDGTNTADVSVLNLPAGSVGANGEIDLGVGVKVYRALLEAGDPGVATVLENILGESPTWIKDTAGRYYTQFDTIPGPFTANKTFTMASFGETMPNAGGGPVFIGIGRTSSSVVELDVAAVDADGIWSAADWIGQIKIEILVYP